MRISTVLMAFLAPAAIVNAATCEATAPSKKGFKNSATSYDVELINIPDGKCTISPGSNSWGDNIEVLSCDPDCNISAYKQTFNGGCTGKTSDTAAVSFPGSTQGYKKTFTNGGDANCQPSVELTIVGTCKDLRLRSTTSGGNSLQATGTTPPQCRNKNAGVAPTGNPEQPADSALQPKQAKKTGDEVVFECSMLGYTTLSKYVIANILWLLPLIQKALKGIAELVTLNDLAKSLEHVELGLQGADKWPGYFLAAIYYVVLDVTDPDSSWYQADIPAEINGESFCDASAVVYRIAEFFNRAIEEHPADAGTVSEKPKTN